MDITAVVALFSGLSEVELITWVERGWVIPDDAGSGLEFHEIDVARVRLIHDLRHGMDIGEDAVPVGAVAARPGLRAAQPAEIRAPRGGGATGRREGCNTRRVGSRAAINATAHGVRRRVCAIWSGVS